MSSSHDESSNSRGFSVSDYVLVKGDRLLLSAVLVGGVFCAVFLLGLFDAIGVAKSSIVTALFSPTITGVFTLITFVITINQLILSWVFGNPGQLSQQVDGTVTFREEVEQLASTPASPTDPGAFVRVLGEAVDRHADRLAEATADESNSELRSDVDSYVGDVSSLASHLREDVDGGSSGTFQVLKAMLSDDYSEKLHDGRWLRNEYAGSLSEEANDALESLISAFDHLSVVRQYVKTLYLQEELALVSRYVLYLGMPALIVLAGITLQYGRSGGPILSGVALLFADSLGFALALSPLAVLTSYVVRFATIARRTAAVGPFTPKEETK
jgi:hypothetical protein